MVLINSWTGDREYAANLEWQKKFAWFPIKVDDGRVIWFETVMKLILSSHSTIYRTRKFPTDFE